MKAEKWDVHPEVHAITVGARATMPEQNTEVLKRMGITETKQQAALLLTAHNSRDWCGSQQIKHAAIRIVSHNTNT